MGLFHLAAFFGFVLFVCFLFWLFCFVCFVEFAVVSFCCFGFALFLFGMVMASLDCVLVLLHFNAKLCDHLCLVAGSAFPGLLCWWFC